jgi:hypothetical protein
VIAAGVMVSVGVMVCFVVAYSGIVRTNEAVGTFDLEAGLSLVKHFTAVGEPSATMSVTPALSEQRCKRNIPILFTPFTDDMLQHS